MGHFVNGQHGSGLAAAPQHHFGPWPHGFQPALGMGLINGGQVHGQHVHADAPHQAGAHTGHQHGCALPRRTGSVAGVAVGIAAGHHADAHGPLGAEGGAVAHGIAGLQILHGNQLAGQGHGGLQGPFTAGVLGMVGSRPVHHDAGAHPV